MHEEIEELRQRIDRVERGAGGRRTFTAAIRRDAVALGKKWAKSGRHMTALADALSLHKTTLQSWMGGGQPKRVRRVEVEPETSMAKLEVGPSTSLVAVLPSGIRLEGLSLADVVELEGALR